LTSRLIYYNSAAGSLALTATILAMNALCDALREFGIDHVDMPATPIRVWSAIRNAKRDTMEGG